MSKFNWKDYIIFKLKLGSFVFALFGWLIIGIFVLGPFFENQLTVLEQILQSKTFIWTLRIIIIATVVLMVKNKKTFQEFFEQKNVKKALIVVFAGGGLGWALFFLTLI